MRVAISLIAFASLCAPVQATMPLAEMPVKLKHSLPFVSVRVSGVPLWLLFDTGATSAIALTARQVSIDDAKLPAQQFRLWTFATPAVDAFMGTPFFLDHKTCFDIPRGRAAIN
jgi:hypothetical protein